MKRIFTILVIIMACILAFAGCNLKREDEKKSTQKETETEKKTEIVLEETDFDADCVMKKGKRYVIVLPISGTIIPVGNPYVQYLSYVSDELVLAAEQKITAEVKALGAEPLWTIENHGESEMCLYVEIIKYIDNEDPDAVGCGIDHEHFYFWESIITD